MERNRLPVIVLTGPTASGKTQLAMELLDYIDMEILSADSRQIYKYMNIGTAKPSIEEINKVKHHFIDILNPDEYYSAGVFASDAQKIITNIHKNNKIPVIVGGTGLYIKNLFDGLFEEVYAEEEKIRIREILDTKLYAEGKNALYDDLLKIDIESAELYSDKNPRRIIRALEHYYLTGEKYSEAKKHKVEHNFIPLYFAFDYPRDVLYDRINSRTEKIFKNGIIKETAEIIEMGFSPEINSLNTIGYKETLDFIFGKISIDIAIELTKQNTRRYAKRQITWFKQVNDMNWLKPNQSKNIKVILDVYEKTLKEIK